MLWLFERTVELAAWVAMIVAWASLGLAVWYFGQWVSTFSIETDAVATAELIRNAAKSAGAFVGFALALGGLACIDRYLFDVGDKR